MTEELERLNACEEYFSTNAEDKNRFALESTALQLRKAMEAVAFAAISPNKEQYSATRKNAAKPVD